MFFYEIEIDRVYSQWDYCLFLVWGQRRGEGEIQVLSFLF